MNKVLRNSLIAVILMSAVAVPRAEAGWSVHRSFQGGYPAAISEARQRSVSAGPTSATTASRKSTAKAPNKLFGTAKCGDGSGSITVVNAEGNHVVILDKIAGPSSKNVVACKTAAKFLHDLVDGKEVEVLWTKKRKGYIVGVVYYKHPQGMVEVNLTLVKNGCAKQSIYDRTAAYSAAEKDARRHKRGMWSGRD